LRSIYFILIFFVFSCGTRYERFKELDPHVFFKKIAFGDYEVKAGGSEYLAISYQYCSSELCLDEVPKNFVFSETAVNPEFWKPLLLGDEFILVLDSGIDQSWHTLFELHDKIVFWPLIVKVKLVSILDEEKYSGPSMLKKSLYQYREIVEIDRMMYSSDSIEYTSKNDCYISVSKMGEGDSIKPKAEVVISYQAYFSDGTKFDDTEQWHDSLTFKYGVPLQIIKGLEQGIAGLREGSEAKLIIPSRLAFGEKGSSSGIVPPFEPLLYDLKIISVSN